MPEVTAEMFWGGFCGLLPWKNHRAWESHTRLMRRPWQTPACGPGSPHPWESLFAASSAPGADRENLLEGLQTPCHQQTAYLTAPC